MKLINIIFIILLSHAQLCSTEKITQQVQKNNQDLLVKLNYSAFQGNVKILFELLNDSFAENYDTKLIQVQINSKNYDENRYYSDLQQTTIVIDVQLKDAFKDMVIKVEAKQSDIQTRTNKQMNGDFYQEIHLGTQLPQLISLDLSNAINLLQNSTWMDFLRLFPLYLIFFNSFQGVYLIILADIKLPQRLYEVIRLLSCFYFKDLRGWTVSQDYPYDIPRSGVLGLDIYSSDQNVQLSRIGVNENSSGQSITSFIIDILMLIYMIYLIQLVTRKLLINDESSQDQTNGQKSMQEIIDLLQCYFLSQNQKDYFKHVQSNYLVIEKLIDYLPTNIGQSIDDQNIQAINGLEIVQFIFMFLFILLELIVKVFQLKNLFEKFKYTLIIYSNSNINFENQQLHSSTKSLVEMLNEQNNIMSLQKNDLKMSQFFKTDKSKDTENFPSQFQNQLSGSIKTSIQLDKKKKIEMPNLTQQQVSEDILKNQGQNADQKIQEIKNQNQEVIFSRTNSLIENNQTEKLEEQQKDKKSEKINTLKLGNNQQQNDIQIDQQKHPQIKIHNVEDIVNEIPQIDKNFLFIPQIQKPKMSQNTQKANKERDSIIYITGRQESLDESDYDIFENINKELNDELNESELIGIKEEFKKIMETQEKHMNISAKMKIYISTHYKGQKEFKKAQNPYTVLLYQDIIQQVNDSYNEGIHEYKIQSLFLREANIKSDNNNLNQDKTIKPVYGSKVYSITSHNQEKYRELQNMFEIQAKKNSENKKKQRDNSQAQSIMQQNTRIFFDLNSYENNTKLNINKHFIHRETFQFNPSDS
ncbi:hypothetical protein ABPG74_001036 [Tetrahymena malaccensis]